jgi:hypothetical protein
MIRLTVYKTSDGVIHENYTDAERHADKRYGDQLTKMAHELVKIEKYTDMLEKLVGYQDSMQLLLDLASDSIVMPEGPEW